ncbi:hypothetical protein H6G06_21965 [Anabaena sphaerica FACHB-251]|uniref:Uncharacterized protein n=1 Tax=Anabaena sphaerica FACHB-251 TaxID=2692883 RepID=A0A926WLR1_9NOST|nr:hypothetical protein [Anabaena sphaerica]MBD2296069.1 hypothetical protein [Anabaena sphaerica FACHB-251]
MNRESKATTPTATDNNKLAQTTNSRQPLELLRDTEAWLRRPTVATLSSILPPKMSKKLQLTSFLAEELLQDLAAIDIKNISDFELQPARIYIGLTFVGFGALMILVLLLYINTLHPELSTVEQIGKYWYPYIGCVCLGVTGMFIIGREVMRHYHKS